MTTHTTVEKLPGEPIAIITHRNPYVPERDIPHAEQELEKYLNETQGPLHVITDFSQVNTSFSLLVISMSEAISRQGLASISSNRIKLVLVGSHRLIELGAQALQQDQYGGLDVPFFANMDEALAYCRSTIQTVS